MVTKKSPVTGAKVQTASQKIKASTTTKKASKKPAVSRSKVVSTKNTTGLSKSHSRRLKLKKSTLSRTIEKKTTVKSITPIHRGVATAFLILAVLFVGAITTISTYKSPVSYAASVTGPIVGIGNKCLDNNRSVVANENKIQLYTCNGTNAQYWTNPGDGTLRVQGYCLDVKGASKLPETLVQLYTCNGTVAQQWKIDNLAKTIVNPNSGLCLDDQYANTSDGNTVWVYGCNGTNAQKWTAPVIVASAPVVTPVPAPVPSPTPAPAPSLAPTPVTADMVLWKDVASAGESINTVLAKPALVNKILKLPEGVFEVSNFRNASVAINVPAGVKGVVGSGNNTIIRIRANTSSYASTVPAQGSGQTNQLYIMRMNNGTQPQVLSDFWLQGTPQGHLYNGVMVGVSKPGTTVKNILITGIPGDAGSPPGETFGLNWWRGSDSITRDIEVDGYSWSGNSFGSRVKGALVGSSPIGYNSHDSARLYNAYTHDSLHGMPTFWQSNNAQTWNLQSIRNVIGINHEESFNIVHHQPVMYGSRTHRHVNFMSSRNDGKLTIIGSTNDEWINSSTSGPIGKGKKMLVLTPTNYTGPNTNKIFTAPTILMDDGVSKAPYLWAH